MTVAFPGHTNLCILKLTHSALSSLMNCLLPKDNLFKDIFTYNFINLGA